MLGLTKMTIMVPFLHTQRQDFLRSEEFLGHKFLKPFRDKVASKHYRAKKNLFQI